MTKKNHLSPDWIVADLLQAWPETIPVFLRHRMGCVGCMMAPFDTLEDVIAIYGMQAENFYSALEKAIRKHEDANEIGQTDELA